jgi:hypothetical protein
MAQFKATWIAFDGTVHDSELDATVHEAKLNSLGLGTYLRDVLKIKITDADVEKLFKDREYITQLLNNETGNTEKRKKSTKTKN